MARPVNFVDPTGHMRADGIYRENPVDNSVVPEPDENTQNVIVMPEDDILSGVADTANQTYLDYINGRLTLQDMLDVYDSGSVKDDWCLTAIMYIFARHCLLQSKYNWSSYNNPGMPPPFVYQTRGTETLMEKYKSANRWYPVSGMVSNTTHAVNYDYWPKVGDIVLYDFKNNNTGEMIPDGRPDHASLVIASEYVYNGNSNSIVYSIIQGNWGGTMNKTEGLLFENCIENHILGICSNNNQYNFGEN